jgi:hypothetical protein
VNSHHCLISSVWAAVVVGYVENIRLACELGAVWLACSEGCSILSPVTSWGMVALALLAETGVFVVAAEGGRSLS